MNDFGKLYNACRNGDEETMKQLVDNGVAVDINHLETAAANGYTNIVSYLINNSSVDPSDEDSAPLRLAARFGAYDAFLFLLEDGRSDPAAEEQYAIRWASRMGHHRIVRKLLEIKEVDPTVNDDEALCWACDQEHSQVVEVLLEDPRVNPMAQNNTPLQRAAYRGTLHSVRMLLKHPKIDVRANKDQAFIYAVHEGTNIYSFGLESNYYFFEIIRMLVEAGCDPAAQDNDAICWAARGGYLKLVYFLLSFKIVDPTVRNFEPLRSSITWIEDRIKYWTACRIPEKATPKESLGNLQVIAFLLKNAITFGIPTSIIDDIPSFIFEWMDICDLEYGKYL